MLPWRTMTGCSSMPARTSTSAPTFSTQGARMKTAWKGIIEPVDVEIRFERLVLAAEGVATHHYVQDAKQAAGRPR